MGLHHKVLRSVKQAAVCRHLGCDVNIQIDAANPGKVVFRISPPSAAEHAIQLFESGASLPARPLLDTLSELHTSVKIFLYQYRQLFSGKEMADTEHD
ncbi:MAG: hypothetical protein JJE30_08900 [Desulfuromonadales bacterium]|nr:hypothetical protein [Desulfuromonadales bacterium]